MDKSKSFEVNSPEDPEQKKIDFILNKALENESEIVANYVSIHKTPELGGEEFETAAKIKQVLDDLGIEIIGQNIGGAGILARIKGNKSENVVALRADIDALEVKENIKNYPRSTKEGLMHACGHDAHTASLLGAANILKQMSDQGNLDGDVLLIFQSNEEKHGDIKDGAVAMIKFMEQNNLRKDIKGFFALHVFSQLERGQVMLSDDLELCGTGEINVKLKTAGGHGKDIKTLPDIDYILSDLKVKIANELDSYWENKGTLVESMGPKIKGDVVDNIILSEASRSWNLRIQSADHKPIALEVYEKIKALVKQSVDENLSKIRERANKKGLAIDDVMDVSQQIEVDINIIPGYRPVVHRSKELVAIADQSGKSVIPGYNRINSGMMGAENFSFYLEELNNKQFHGVFIMIGAANTENGYPKTGHHSPDFAIDPGVIHDMSALYAALAVKTLDQTKEQK